jgi:6-phosphogluconolactonase
VGTEVTPLYLLNFDEKSGNISLIKSTTIVQNPSFIALHTTGQYLYTVSEVDQFNGVQNSGAIAAYKIDRQTGDLTPVGQPVYSLGGAPTHISIDKTQRWVGVANYDGGSYGVWKINDDFTIEAKPASWVQDQGHGPMPQQDGPHAHEFVFNPSNTLAVVPNLGTDTWNVYAFDAGVGLLSSFVPMKSDAGSGPRHFIFHPTLPYAYGVCEIASTVTVFKTGTSVPLLQIQVISTLPAPQPTAAAEVQLSPDGKFLYVSNRLTGVNGTITVFSIDQSTGKISTIGYTGTQGVHPRFFGLSKDGRFVLVANQISGDVKVFERNASTGAIGQLVGSVSGLNQPSHILQI